jgi:Oxidoreductase molybdopterin binding domain
MIAVRRGSGRRTNLALLVLLTSAVTSGVAAFAIGSGWALWVVIAHGVVGFAIIALVPSKVRIIRRGRRVRAPAGTWPSLFLGVLVVVVVLTGLGHSTGLLRSLGPVSAMQIHVAAALASIPLFLWHVVARPVRPRVTDLSRRAVVRSGAVLGASALAYAGLAGLVIAAGLPGADRRFTGSFEDATFDPERMPVTQWLRDSVPQLDSSRWALTIKGPDGARTLGLEQLASFDDRVRATLDCTGGWYSTQWWDGVFISRLLPDLGQSESIVVRSATGYSRRFPSSDAGHLLLAVRLGGAPLTPGHGAPARLVAPGRRGFWWVKWVTDISSETVPWWWQPPLPLA